MKKKLLCIILGVMLILSFLMPVSVMAAGDTPAPPHVETDIAASMIVTWVEDTVLGDNVFPIFNEEGNQVGWSVVDRQMTGEIAGSLEGQFTVTYNAQLDLLQQGTVWGTIEIDMATETSSKIIRGTFVGFTALVGYTLEPPYSVDVIFYGELDLNDGSGIYENIAGSAMFGAGLEAPLTLLLDAPIVGHVIGVQGSMGIAGSYVRVDVP